MQTTNRLFDDIAKVANGAVSTLNGMKGEIEAMVRHRVERIMCDADMVPRDEFEAVKAMAAEARTQQEALEKRVATLEAKLGKPAPAAKKAPMIAVAVQPVPVTCPIMAWPFFTLTAR